MMASLGTKTYQKNDDLDIVAKIYINFTGCRLKRQPVKTYH